MKNILRFLIMTFCLFSSTNLLRSQWKQIKDFPDEYVAALAVSDTCLYASTYYGLFLSTNSGTSWTPIDSGLPVLGNGAPIAVSGKCLFAGTYGGVFRSSNNGTTWTAVDSGFTSRVINTLAVHDTNIFVGTGWTSWQDSAVYRSTDNGNTWSNLSSLPNALHFAFIGTNIFAASSYTIPNGGADYGVFLSTNNGNTWSGLNTGLHPYGWTGFPIAAVDSDLFAGGQGIYSYSIKAGNWITLDSGLWNPIVTSLCVNDSDIFAGAGLGGVFLSTNKGTSWRGIMNNDLPTVEPVIALAVSGPYLIAAVRDSGLWRKPLQEILDVKQTPPNSLITFILDQNYPNPFNPNTTISFTIPSKVFVTLKVFDIMGRTITTIVSKELSAGNYIEQWHAADLSSGVYFYRLQAGNFVQTKKLLLLK